MLLIWACYPELIQTHTEGAQTHSSCVVGIIERVSRFRWGGSDEKTDVAQAVVARQQAVCEYTGVCGGTVGWL